MSVVRNKFTWLAAALAALVLAWGVGTAIRSGSAWGEEPHAKVSADAGVNSAKALSQAFRKAAAEVSPAVVKITSVTDAKPLARGNTNRSGNRSDNPFKGTPFEDFFGNDGNGAGGFSFNDGNRSSQHAGVGSGVIIDKSGTVLTNNHVVEGADHVTVRLPDGREFAATDIKTDPQSDLAVLKIKANTDLPYAKLGNSDDEETGDWVIAIGNPFELETTVSAGIISGKGRELGSIRRSQFLQTDAAINPGNSGGPLVNLDGEVIGINTAIASNSGGYQGIGFAIPINQAKWISSQLLKTGSVKRAYLGVGIDEVSPELAAKLGVKPNEGVVVMEVQPKSPAAEAGIKTGDVITEFDGHKIKTRRDLQERVERAAENAKQSFTIVRDGHEQTMSIMLKPLPADVAQTEPKGNRGDNEEAAAGFHAEKYGFSVSDMNQKGRQTYQGFEGVMISRVEEDGPAAAKGLRTGMLILEVNKKPVKDVASFEEALKTDSKNGVLLLVRTQQGNQQLVVVKSSS